MEFTHIKDATKAAAGNISVQIKKLQEAGYISVEKTLFAIIGVRQKIR